MGSIAGGHGGAEVRAVAIDVGGVVHGASEAMVDTGGGRGASNADGIEGVDGIAVSLSLSPEAPASAVE